MNKIVEYQIDKNYIIGIIVISAILCISLLISLAKFDVNAFKTSLIRNIKHSIDKFIYNKDAKLAKQIENPTWFSKLNVFLYDIKIDLDMFKEATLYQFKLIIYLITSVISIAISLFVFRNIITILFLFPLVFIAVVAMMFFHIVNKKRQRLLDIINAENLLSIEMEAGFETAVKNNIGNLPVHIRDCYQNFIINRDRLNYSSEEAINKLKIELGTYSWYFLNRVNLYENYRDTQADAEMFKDTVITNQIRLRGYNDVNKVVKSVKASFWVSIGMSGILWVLEFIFIKAVRWFYLSFFVGQIIFMLNILLLILVNLRLQILNSEEL